jgi:hypothetical protein
MHAVKGRHIERIGSGGRKGATNCARGIRLRLSHPHSVKDEFRMVNMVKFKFRYDVFSLGIKILEIGPRKKGGCG